MTGGRGPIELKVDYRKLNTFFSDYARNISKGATFIKTKKTLPPGTRFRFKLSVPGRARPFELDGEVVDEPRRPDEPGLAIRFVWEDGRDRAAFEASVESLLSESLGPHVAQHLLRQPQNRA